jgi:hypothetical protein
MKRVDIGMLKQSPVFLEGTYWPVLKAERVCESFRSFPVCVMNFRSQVGLSNSDQNLCQDPRGFFTVSIQETLRTVITLASVEGKVMLHHCFAVAQAVGHRRLTAEVWVRAQFCPCGIFGVLNGIETGFSPNSSVFPVNIIPPWLSILIHHLGDGQ